MKTSSHPAVAAIDRVSDVSPAAAREMAAGRGPAVAVASPALALSRLEDRRQFAENFQETEAGLRTLLHVSQHEISGMLPSRRT